MPAPAAAAAAAVKVVKWRTIVSLVAGFAFVIIGALIGLVVLPIGIAIAAAPVQSDGATPGAGGELVPSDQGWWRPVPDKVTSLFGPRRPICNAVGCTPGFHEGLDFGSACGTPIRAVYAGVVTFTAAQGGFGNRVIVNHGGGIESIYGHVQNGGYRVQVGDSVEGGDVVAISGNTGIGSGCHLDLKIRIDGAVTDPAKFLIDRGVAVF